MRVCEYAQCVTVSDLVGDKPSPMAKKVGELNTDVDAHDHEHHHHDAEKPSFAVGPGAPSGKIATPFEQAPGLERVEYLAQAQGINIFMNEPLKVDAFGTLEKPILVETLEGERVAGCSGFPKYSHDIAWMKLTGDKICRCPDCGQAFKLIPAELAHVEPPTTLAKAPKASLSKAAH